MDIYYYIVSILLDTAVHTVNLDSLLFMNSTINVIYT